MSADRLLIGGSDWDDRLDDFFATGSAGDAEGSGNSKCLAEAPSADGPAPTVIVRGCAIGVPIGGSASILGGRDGLLAP